MKRLVLAAVLLVLVAGGYYFRGFFLETQDLNIHLYTLYSGNPDELYRFEPVVEAQMRRLPVLQDVNSDLQVEISETIDLDRLKAEGCDRLRDDRTKFSACVARAKVMLPGITISFKLAPGVALGQAIAQVPDMGAAGTTGHDHDGFLQATGPMSDPANYAARPANGEEQLRLASQNSRVPETLLGSGALIPRGL